MHKLLAHIRQDKADANIISMVSIIPLVVGLFVTIVDMSLFFSNKAQIDAVVTDGARTVAIVGGAGDDTKGTPLENAYGLTKNVCTEAINAGAKGVDKSSNPIECNLGLALAKGKTININGNRVNVDLSSNVDIKKIDCSPDVTQKDGKKPNCEIEWDWNSIPGSIFRLTKTQHSDGYSEAEVSMSKDDLRTRK